MGHGPNKAPKLIPIYLFIYVYTLAHKLAGPAFEHTTTSPRFIPPTPSSAVELEVEQSLSLGQLMNPTIIIKIALC